MTRMVLILSTLFLLAACNGRQVDNRAEDAVISREQLEIEALDTAIRTDLLKDYEYDGKWHWGPVFIAVAQRNRFRLENPPPDLITRLSDMPMRVLSIADQDTISAAAGVHAVRPGGHFIEKGTHAEGIARALRILRWVSPTELEISISRFGPLQGGGYSMRLVRSGGRWIVVDTFDVEIG